MPDGYDSSGGALLPAPTGEPILPTTPEARFHEDLKALLPPGAAGALLVACSGGGDSVALAALTALVAPGLGLAVHLAHCDHGLREGSAAEAEPVRALAERLELPFHPLTLAIPTDGNREAAARRARYAALEGLAKHLEAAALLTGHTADDRAETLWLWLLRGTGPAGLRPLPASRRLRPGLPLLVLRPLLGFRREELRDYLRSRELPWLEDPSNQDLDLRRNRVRHRLLPHLVAEYGIDPTRNAVNLADQMGELLDYLDAELDAQDLAAAELGPLTWDRSRMAELPKVLLRRFLARLLARHGIHQGRAVDAVLRHMGTRGFVCIEMNRDWRFVITDEVLALEPIWRPSPDSPALPGLELESWDRPLPEGASARVALAHGWGLRVTRRAGNPGPPTNPSRAVFDADLLAEPLRLMIPRPGQRIRLLGGPGSRLLSDIFIDRKVPRTWRQGWPVLLDAEERTLWLPGLARGVQAPVTPQTRRCLCLDLEGPSA